MKTLKGPGVFVESLLDHEPNCNSLELMAKRARSLGLSALQLPGSRLSGDFFDSSKAIDRQALWQEVVIYREHREPA